MIWKLRTYNIITEIRKRKIWLFCGLNQAGTTTSNAYPTNILSNKYEITKTSQFVKTDRFNLYFKLKLNQLKVLEFNHEKKNI
jgi:hypothetical protein